MQLHRDVRRPGGHPQRVEWDGSLDEDGAGGAGPRGGQRLRGGAAHGKARVHQPGGQIGHCALRTVKQLWNAQGIALGRAGVQEATGCCAQGRCRH